MHAARMVHHRAGAIPFIGFWEDPIDEVETGGRLTIALGDVPRGWIELPAPVRPLRNGAAIGLRSTCFSMQPACGSGLVQCCPDVTTDGSVSQNRETLPADRGKTRGSSDRLFTARQTNKNYNRLRGSTAYLNSEASI